MYAYLTALADPNPAPPPAPRPHPKDIGHDPSLPETRLYATAAAQPYHNDASDVVGLLCLANAAEGGVSHWASSASVHNEILRRRPDLAEVRGAGGRGRHRVITLSINYITAGLDPARPLLSACRSHVSVHRPTPDLIQHPLQVLAGPWYFDRKGEVPHGKLPYMEIPVFNYHAVRRLPSGAGGCCWFQVRSGQMPSCKSQCPQLLS